MERSPVCDCDVIHGDIVDKVNDMMPPGKDFFDLVNLYNAFSGLTRLKILWALNCHEMCVCDIAALLNMTKSAVSHQLKILRMCNLVNYHKQGKEVIYALADDHVKGIFEKGFEHIHHV